MGEKYRKKLKNLGDEERHTFRGTFVREGKKPAYKGGFDRTILLKGITNVTTGEEVASHLWFNYTKGFAALGYLAEGDVIEFDARVAEYWKGYSGRREDVYKPVKRDYKLSYPTRIVKVAAAPPSPVTTYFLPGPDEPKDPTRPKPDEWVSWEDVQAGRI